MAIFQVTHLYYGFTPHSPGREGWVTKKKSMSPDQCSSEAPDHSSLTPQLIKL